MSSDEPTVILLALEELFGQGMLTGLDDWQIWWGANLSTPEEELVAGRVADVLPAIEAARAAVKESAGWVMDVYLLRRP